MILKYLRTIPIIYIISATTNIDSFLQVFRRKICIKLMGEKVSIAGTYHAYTELRQVTYTHSYLQLLVRPQGEEPRKVKIFFPNGIARNIHDILSEMQNRNTKVIDNKTQTNRGKTRRSLGVVCDQIVEVAKEVTPLCVVQSHHIIVTVCRGGGVTLIKVSPLVID